MTSHCWTIFEFIFIFERKIIVFIYSLRHGALLYFNKFMVTKAINIAVSEGNAAMFVLIRPYANFLPIPTSVSVKSSLFVPDRQWQTGELGAAASYTSELANGKNEFSPDRLFRSIYNILEPACI
jgi:hypothetical protein